MPKYFLLIIAFFNLSISLCAQEQNYQEEVNRRLMDISKSLNNMTLVRRFQSIETPCVSIDSSDNNKASVSRSVINSNFRIRFKKDGIVDSSGVQCLSQHCSQYMKLQVKAVDTSEMKISGDALISYGYPASSLIQYLGMHHKNPDKDDLYFKRMLTSTGRFIIYPDDNKYRIKFSFDGYYNNKDTFYAFIEIVRDINNDKVYQILFDQMSMYKSDKNAQISLRYSSTTFNQEAIYFTDLVYHSLKHFKDAGNTYEKAQALWLFNFLGKEECPSCKFVYKQAELKLKAAFQLPNTEPSPAK